MSVVYARDSIELLAKHLKNKKLNDFERELDNLNAIVNNQEVDKKFKETEKYFTTKIY